MNLFTKQKESQTEKTILWLPGREGGGIHWETGIDICILLHIRYSFPGGSDGKESACNAGDPSSIWEDTLEKEMATHSSTG